METTILRTFIAIIDEGSFSAAARRMGISRSICSKYITDLEHDLGARLLTRTTRSVSPTAVGLEYSQRVREALRMMDAANEGVRAASGHPSGALKIGAPVGYTLKVLQPHILRFTQEYPEIQLEFVLDDGFSDLVSDSFDAVIRIGNLEDSTLHARKLDEAEILLVASPDYVAAKGAPQEPADLLQHDCLHYTNLRGTGTWPLRRSGQVIFQRVQPVFAANNSEMLHQMALSGRGVTLMPKFAVAGDLEAGKLIPLMSDYRLPGIPIHLVYATGKLMTAAMRTFMEFLLQSPRG
ncbi:LysR family transcriptional regulator [Paracoccus sp. Z330]|uniref:LysR family transcriptional regulator n=1 Tax=Paracoccus onchidii TaxID=3017813 RepID=A0ABT4ZE73_9RHOB|nr:LysR family transcriptional regulator [Paracoccus onchidii]MDB6177644.1 LysR family transcriptional regulator [Paracoccus onchidii]